MPVSIEGPPLNPSSFALAGHNHDADYVNVSGDTMTGTLNTQHLLPAADATYSIGSVAFTYDQIHVDRVQGDGGLVLSDGTRQVELQTSVISAFAPTIGPLDLGHASFQWRRLYVSDQIISTENVDPPFVVASSAKVAGLNADLLDGMEATDFVAVAGDTMTGRLVLPAGATGVGGWAISDIEMFRDASGSVVLQGFGAAVNSRLIIQGITGQAASLFIARHDATTGYQTTISQTGALAVTANTTVPAVFNSHADIASATTGIAVRNLTAFANANRAIVELGTNTSTQFRTATSIRSGWSDTTDASRTSTIEFWTVNLAAAAAKRFDITGDLSTFTTAVNFPAGAEGAPSLQIGDTDSGLYSPTAGQVAVTTNGTQRALIGTTQTIWTLPFRGANGTAAAPTYSFTSATNYGVYYDSSATALAFSTGGSRRMMIDGFGEITVDTGNVILTMGGLAAPAGTVSASSLNSDSTISGYEILAAAGSAAAPAYNFGTSMQATTGLYYNSGIGFATDGTLAAHVDLSNRWGFNTSAITTAQAFVQGANVASRHVLLVRHGGSTAAGGHMIVGQGNHITPGTYVSYFGVNYLGQVGIGSAPTQSFMLNIDNFPASPASAYGMTLGGIEMQIEFPSTTTTQAFGIRSRIVMGTGTYDTGSIYNLIALAPTLTNMTGTVATAGAIHIANMGSSKVTTAAGITMIAQAGATNNIGMWFNTATVNTTGVGFAWGTNPASPHLNLYASASGVLKTDNSLHVGTDFRHLGTFLGFYGNAVVARQTYGAPTGTAERTAFATYTAPAISNPPTQAQVQALADHVQILSRRLKAIIDDNRSVGLFG